MKSCLNWVACGLLLSLAACGDDSSTDDVDSTAVDGTDTEESDASTDEDETATETTEDGATEEGEGETAGTDAPAESTDATSTDEGTDTVVLMNDEGASIEIVFSEEGTECGTELCQNAQIEGSIVGVRGCCFDEDEEICGFDMRGIGVALNLRDAGCEQLDKPGSSDPNCPESEPVGLTLPIEGVPDEVLMPGCCQENGECGFAADFGDFGFGCVGPERFGQDPTGECVYEP